MDNSQCEYIQLRGDSFFEMVALELKVSALGLLSSRRVTSLHRSTPHMKHTSHELLSSSRVTSLHRQSREVVFENLLQIPGS